MTEDREKTIDLEPFFEAGRNDAPQLSAALMDRIMEDIDQVADERLAVKPLKARPNIWQRVLEGIGGWPTLSGMATAGVVGIVFGISPPDAVSDFTSTVLTGTSDLYLVDPYAGFGFDSFEG